MPSRVSVRARMSATATNAPQTASTASTPTITRRRRVRRAPRALVAVIASHRRGGIDGPMPRAAGRPGRRLENVTLSAADRRLADSGNRRRRRARAGHARPPAPGRDDVPAPPGARARRAARALEPVTRATRSATASSRTPASPTPSSGRLVPRTSRPRATCFPSSSSCTGRPPAATWPCSEPGRRGR